MEFFANFAERFGLATGMLAVFAFAVWRVIRWIGTLIEQQIVPIFADLIKVHKDFLLGLQNDLEKNNDNHRVIIQALDALLERIVGQEIKLKK